MGDHQTESFCADAFTPIRATYPIAHGGFSVAGWQRTFARRAIAHSAYRLACLVPDYCPCGGIVEHCADYLQALLLRLMRRPACTQSDLRFTCILIQCLSICVKPRAKGYSFCLHHFKYVKLQQFVDMPEVEIQVVDISTYHSVERHTATLVVNPVVVELGLVNRTDDMANMLVVQFQQHHEL